MVNESWRRDGYPVPKPVRVAQRTSGTAGDLDVCCRWGRRSRNRSAPLTVERDRTPLAWPPRLQHASRSPNAGPAAAVGTKARLWEAIHSARRRPTTLMLPAHCNLVTERDRNGRHDRLGGGVHHKHFGAMPHVEMPARSGTPDGSVDAPVPSIWRVTIGSARAAEASFGARRRSPSRRRSVAAFCADRRSADRRISAMPRAPPDSGC